MLVEPRGTMSDSVLLSFPRDSRYYAVARLVVGGMAAPLQMSYDALDDLQLAISSLLDHEDLALDTPDEEVQLRLTVDERQLTAALGNFASGSLDRAFDRSSKQGGEMGLRRLLDTIIDEVSVETADGGEWVTLTKHVKALA
jgi:anti-sigma regulatory factor (Ser/Thr protein kinase)